MKRLRLLFGLAITGAIAAPAVILMGAHHGFDGRAQARSAGYSVRSLVSDIVTGSGGSSGSGSAATIGQCASAAPGNTLVVGDHTYSLEGIDTFTKAAPVGSFAATSDTQVVYTGDHGMAWTEYPDGWPSTYTGGVEGYQPSTVQSVHDGVLDWYLHNDSNGNPVSANPSPEPGGNRYQTYGVWSFCERIAPSDSTNLDDFYQAPLLWPPHDGDGPSAESDFPEGHLSAGDLSAFAHHSGGQQDAFDIRSADPSFDPYQWHVYTQEWGPGYRSYYVDGELIGTSTSQVWSTQERWQLQVEPSGRNDGGTGHVYVNWVWIGTPGSLTQAATPGTSGGTGPTVGSNGSGTSGGSASATGAPTSSTSSVTSGTHRVPTHWIGPWRFPTWGGTHRSSSHSGARHKRLGPKHRSTRWIGPWRLAAWGRTHRSVHRRHKGAPRRPTPGSTPTTPQAGSGPNPGGSAVSGASGSGSPAGSGTSGSGAGRIQHVVWIWMENQDYSNIYGPSPYETSVANQFGLAENYYAIGHFSADNYIAGTSGAAWNSCLGGDGSPSSCPQSQDNIFHQLGSGQAQNLIDPGNTDVNHQPVEYYTDLGCTGPGSCSYEQSLPSTFSATTFNPAFTFITPNKTDDGHDSSASTADSWLSTEVPKIMATPQYASGSMAIFIAYDESNVNDTQGATSPPNNHVYVSVISPYTSAVKDTAQYTHYSLLRTTEELLRLPLLGSSASANSMLGHFGF